MYRSTAEMYRCSLMSFHICGTPCTCSTKGGGGSCTRDHFVVAYQFRRRCKLSHASVKRLDFARVTRIACSIWVGEGGRVHTVLSTERGHNITQTEYTQWIPGDD